MTENISQDLINLSVRNQTRVEQALPAENTKTNIIKRITYYLKIETGCYASEIMAGADSGSISSASCRWTPESSGVVHGGI